MQLSRRIVRELFDGKRITVDRTWRVIFSQQGQGISVSGEQLSATVDAPAKLAALAAIEENRSTDGMWPILLSRDGMIVAAGSHADEATLEAAVREAEKLLVAQGEGPRAMAGHRTALAQLQRAGAPLIDQMPTDLFFPVEEERFAAREVALPDGAKGTFEIRYDAKRATSASWLASARRTLVTRIGNDAQTSSDEWEMALA